MDCGVEFVSATLGNKKNLVFQCGSVVKILLQTCQKVIIVWDLHPSWGQENPCLHDDRQGIFASLRNSGVDLNRVSLTCIHQMLESWLIADNRAVQAFIGRLKHPRKPGKIPGSWRKDPDQVENPKVKLTQLFQKELGRSRRYIDFQHAERIALLIADFDCLSRSASFHRYWQQVCGN
jgi:hypothetical protein